MSNRLANKITIITGATSGIGEATARRFIEEGATVVLAGRSEEKGEALAKELGERAVFKRTDIMSEDDIAALVDFTVEKFGRLDCLFNNAGAGDRRPGALPQVGAAGPRRCARHRVLADRAQRRAHARSRPGRGHGAAARSVLADPGSGVRLKRNARSIGWTRRAWARTNAT